MSKKKIQATLPLITERSYRYNGIAVPVRINFKTKKISLVEAHPTDDLTKAKKWVFAERELEYMQGWQNILDAMKYAIAEATKELQEYDDLIEKEALELSVAINEQSS